MQVFEVIITVRVEKSERVTWEDVEWAVRDLIFDDELGNPNFTLGVITSIVAKEIDSG
jgi:hypothetical protein